MMSIFFLTLTAIFSWLAWFARVQAKFASDRMKKIEEATEGSWDGYDKKSRINVFGNIGAVVSGFLAFFFFMAFIARVF